MRYDFYCQGCEKVHTLNFSMNDDSGRKSAVCPDCNGSLERVFNTIGVKVNAPNSKEPVKMSVLKHKNSQLGKDSIYNRIPGARIDEKTGRAVIDVVSNVRDPLGKKATEKQNISVGQKVRKRK